MLLFKLTGMVLVMAGALFASSNSDGVEPDYAALRSVMMTQVVADVQRNSQVLGRPALSTAVNQAMNTVPRHLFVPVELRSHAYANRPLPIGENQTISQPTVVALMTDLLALKPDDKVLEVGTGSGYQAAVLAEVVPKGQVFSIEIIPSLAESARNRLADLGYPNVFVKQGDGYLGIPDEAPFAGIIVTAAAASIPQPLIDQLEPGGRLVIPVGPQGQVQQLTVLLRSLSGDVVLEEVLSVRFVPLTRAENFADPE